MKEKFSKINGKFYIALSGLLLGASVAFAEIGIMAYFALIPLALVLYCKLFGESYSTKSAYLDGFIFFLCFDIVTFHWFTYFYPLDFAGLNNFEAIIVILLAWLGLSAVQGVFSAFVFVVLSKLARVQFVKNHPILIAFFAPMLFVVNEWTQTFTWAGVPWSRIAISQTEMPIFLQTASLFGSYFITFVIVLCNFLVAFVVFSKDAKKLALKLVCGVMAGFVVLSTVLYFIPFANKERPVKIATVQGNFLSQENSGSLFYDGRLARYRDLSIEATKEGAEVIIWPEGVFPRDISSKVELDGKLVKIDEFVEKLSSEIGVTIIIGTVVEDVENEKAYNCVSAFYPDGTSEIGAYSKIRIVPFGEFIPMRSFIESVLPILAQVFTLPTSLTPGEKSTTFGATASEDAIQIGTLLCFDSIYETLGIDSARAGAEIFIVPSDDSWFYDSRALNMHHAQNILRAVEQGKYTVNSGNTGMSSFVSDKGEVISKLPIFTADYLIETVYPSSHRTLYSYIGNLFVYLCVAATILPFVWQASKKIKDKK